MPELLYSVESHYQVAELLLTDFKNEIQSCKYLNKSAEYTVTRKECLKFPLPKNLAAVMCPL
jgi:hypothetical protein